MTNLLLMTLADRAGSRSWRICGKLAVASMLRHLWNGRIEVLRSFGEPLYPVARVGLDEEVDGSLRPVSSAVEAWRRRARKRQLERLAGVDGGSCEWVLVADGDCLALRNLDHLFAVDAEVLVSRGRCGVEEVEEETPGGWKPQERSRDGGTGSRSHGVDPGFVAVRGARAAEFGRALKEAGGLEAGPLAEVLASGDFKVAEFERGEVLRPCDPGVTLEDLANAAVVHFTGMKVEDKQRLMFAFHLMAVYGDKDGLFFEMLES